MSVREDDILLGEIQGLLRGDGADGPLPSLAVIEDTLTAGYARALALEAERLRLEREVARIVRRIGGDDTADQAQELVGLARRLAGADARLARLRSMLNALKLRAAEARAASVPSV